MGIWSTIKNRGKTIDKAVGDGEERPEDQQDEGTPRGEARKGCYHIDPVTKQPKHPEGH